MFMAYFPGFVLLTIYELLSEELSILKKIISKLIRTCVSDIYLN